jgi:hypothetical protein
MFPTLLRLIVALDRCEKLNGHNAVADVADVAQFAGNGRRVCAQCGADDDGKLQQFGGVYLHKECRRFWRSTATGKNTPTGETA